MVAKSTVLEIGFESSKGLVVLDQDSWLNLQRLEPFLEPIMYNILRN